MRVNFALLFLITINFSFSQTDKYDDLIQINSKTVTFYTNTHFKLAKKDCSDFYVECKFNDKSLVFEDTLKAFYKNKKLSTAVNFSKGMKNGKFISYHKNGKTATEGLYVDDIREEVWKDYYENGLLHKVVEYKKDTILLLEFYNKKGERLVVNGKGYFKDGVVNPLGGKYRFEGNIVDGAMDGEWLIYVNDELIGKEVFKNKAFINGISYSAAMGSQSYNDQFYATFLDAIFLESLTFKIIRMKCDITGMVVNIDKSNELKNTLKKHYATLLRNYMPKDYWFFAGLSFNGKTLKDVTIFSSNESIDKLKLAEFLKRIYGLPDYAVLMNGSKSLLPMAIVNGELFIQGDAEIALLGN